MKKSLLLLSLVLVGCNSLIAKQNALCVTPLGVASLEDVVVTEGAASGLIKLSPASGGSLQTSPSNCFIFQDSK